MVPTGPVLRKRLMVLMTSFSLCFLLLAVQLFRLQVIEAESLQKRAVAQWTQETILPPKRGAITDRNGTVLALSATAYIASVSPRQVLDAKRFAELLAPVLNMDEATIERRASDRGKGGVNLKRQLSKETALQLRVMMAEHKARGSTALDGLYLEEDQKRYYPMGDLASQLIGFTTTDGVGQTGLEKVMDEMLKGKAGYVLDEIDGKGRALQTGEREYVASQDGNQVVLTVDAGIQTIVEQAAREAMTVNNAKSVRILVMEPNTGEILAMCMKPGFDLNNPPRQNIELLNELARNRIVSDAYEPGSTFKILTTASALEAGVTRTSEGFYCTGVTSVDGSKIHCWGRPHGAETMAKALQNSCNPVFVELGVRLGVDRFYHYLEAFGLGQKTGIDLPGESAGILIPRAKCKRVDIARIGFGQSIALTPLQLLRAACAAVNGGRLMKPYVVQSVTSPEGRVLLRNEPRVVDAAISVKTSATMRTLLEDVVTYGGGKNAFLKSYRVAGKTGTAQFYRDGRVITDVHIGSFLGFAPADSPKLAVLVIVDEAGIRPDFGSVTAAPFAKQILERAMIHLGIAPNGETLAETKRVTVPLLVGQDTQTALKALKEAGLSGLLDGVGARVVGQLPEAGSTMAENGLVMLYVEGTRATDNEDQTVPDLTGLSIGEANRLLKSYGMRLKLSGSGLAVKQTPAAGSKPPENREISVLFETPGKT